MKIDFKQIIETGELDKTIIANSKRLFELMKGNNVFFNLIVSSNSIPSEYLNKGIIDNIPQKELEYLVIYFKTLILEGVKNLNNIEHSVYLKQYISWEKNLTHFVDERIKRGETVKNNPQYDKWRNIQINRCMYELDGSFTEQLIHIPFALELSSGCSINCDFCGLQAGKLKSVFKYNETNKKLWNEMLMTLKNHFGQAALNSICYYATEPSDNPDYFRFLQDYKDVFDTLPQTTTALPKNKINWLSKITDLYTEDDIYCRISVNSQDQLNEIHETYSAEELLSIILLINYADSSKLTKSGKLLNDDLQTDNENTIEGTINCVSGFLINLCTQNIKLITPCIATKTDPLGYKILHEGIFSNIEEFNKFVEESISIHMKTYVNSEDILDLHESITIEKQNNGVRFNSKYYNQTIKGDVLIPKIGDLLESGNVTLKEIQSKLNGDGNQLQIATIVQKLKEQGILKAHH